MARNLGLARSISRCDLTNRGGVVVGEVFSRHRNHLTENQLRADRVPLERTRQLLVKRCVRLARHLGTAVLLAARSRADLDRRRQQLDELVELRQPALELQVASNLKLHADAEAIHAIRVVHWPHRQQVLKEAAILAVVGQLHVAVDAATQRVLDHSHRLRLRFRTLKEAAVATRSLILRVARHAAELAVDKEHRVAWHRHVADHDARRVRLGHRCE